LAATSRKGNSAAVWLPRMKWTVSNFRSILPASGVGRGGVGRSGWGGVG
jgi:hypothetical protein